MFDDWKKLGSLLDVIRYRESRSGAQTCLTWYTAESDSPHSKTTYSELWVNARSVAASLQGMGLRVGDPVMLLYSFDDAIKFSFSLWGCFCAGMPVVPAYPPEMGKFSFSLRPIFFLANGPPHSGLKKAALIIKDCGARAIITTSAIAKLIPAGFPPVLVIDQLDHATLARSYAEPSPPLGFDTVAVLQYTSGSTGAPKGVIQTHGNVFHVCRMQLLSHGTREGSQLASWLPFFHTNALIMTYCMCVFAGFPYHVMAPATFVSRPLKLLQICSRERVAMLSSANFSLDLMASRCTDEDVRSLDLSHMRCIFAGGEMIRGTTLENFCRKFAPAGFTRTKFMPGYGMTEDTCVNTIFHPDTEFHAFSFSARALERGHAVRVAPGRRTRALWSPWAAARSPTTRPRRAS